MVDSSTVKGTNNAYHPFPYVLFPFSGGSFFRSFSRRAPDVGDAIAAVVAVAFAGGGSGGGGTGGSSASLLRLFPGLGLVSLFDAHRGPLQLELFRQRRARAHAGEVFGAENLKDVALHRTNNAGLAARRRHLHVDLHQRKPQSVAAVLAAREVRENEKAAESGVGLRRFRSFRIDADERGGYQRPHQAPAEFVGVVRVRHRGHVSVGRVGGRGRRN